MEWNDRFSVGVGMIDSDHKQLIGLVNQLHDAMRAGHGKDVLGKTLDGLIDYTKGHFGREEAEMSRHAYPQAAAHKAEHTALAKKVLEIQAQFKSGDSAVLSLQVMSFLRDWLINHISKTDMALGQFLKTKQAAAAPRKSP